MKITKEILSFLKKQTDTILLFHSGIGKDSIVLLDLLIKYGFKVQPVFMYVIEILQLTEKYILWAENKYKVKFIRTPAYYMNNYHKIGYLGLEQKQIANKSLTQLNNEIRQQTGIEWTVYGFKKVDGLNRRILLNELYLHGINEKTKKIYPLTNWKNSECLAYIKLNKLIPPLAYNPRKPSSDIELTDKSFLFYMEKNYPSDLKKIFNTFPETQALLNLYKNEAE